MSGANIDLLWKKKACIGTTGRDDESPHDQIFAAKVAAEVAASATDCLVGRVAFHVSPRGG